MSTTIEVDLKDVLAKLDQKLDRIEQKFDHKFDRMEQKFDALTKDVADIKTEVKVLQERQNAGQNALEKRLDNLGFWLRSVGAGIVLSILAIGLKVFGITGIN